MLHRVMAHRQRHQIGQRRAVTVHRIERFHRDPHPPGTALSAPSRDDVVHRGHIIVRGGQRRDTGRIEPVADAGMDQRVMDNQVAGSRQGGDQGGIGGKAGGKIQRRLTAEETGGFLFQHFMLGMIAAQQARAAGAYRHPARQRIARRIAQPRGFS